MLKLVQTTLLLFCLCEVSDSNKSFSRHSIVPFTDDFAWDNPFDGDFGWRPDLELPSIRSRKAEEIHGRLKASVGHKDKAVKTQEVTTLWNEEVLEETTKRTTDANAPKFHDVCRGVFCRIGRTCKVSASEGKAECVCAEVGYCRSHRKEVCGSDGLIYPSHCELHRVACQHKKHIGIDHTGKRCASGVSYTAKLGYLSVEHVTKKFFLTTPMSPTSTRVKAERICVERSYSRFKNNLVHYHCARLGETDCFFNHTKKSLVVSNMFSYYDANGSNLLEREELMAIEHLDHLDRLSQSCHLADLLTFDDLDHEINGTISKTEFFIAFKIVEPILEDNLKVFTTFVSTGNSVELKCGIRGANRIIWKRHGHALNDFSSNDAKILDDGSLYIGQLELYHMGNYTCQGSSNDHIVQTHVLFVQMVPVVHVHPLTQFHLPGATATLKCHVDGVPLPEISWEKNEAPFSPETENRKHHVFLYNNTTLEIRSLSYKIDAGAYKCTAKNAAGLSHDIGTVVVENADVPVHFSSELKQSELFVVFHDYGYTVYELNHCHIQHQLAGNFQLSPRQTRTGDGNSKTLPGGSSDEGRLCLINKTCSWGDAVNIRDEFVYVTQPDLHRVLVIEVTNRMNPVEVISTDGALFPVKLEYVETLDQVWVTLWTSSGGGQGTKVFQVVNGASRNITHRLMLLTGTSEIQNVFLPANDNLRNKIRYGYIHYEQQMSLQRFDLMSLTTVHTIDLAEHQCIPDNLAFLPLGGYVLINCAPVAGVKSFHLVLDYITDAVLKKSDVSGRFYLSPDVRHLVIVGNKTLSAYTVTADGQIEHIFDHPIHLDISHLSFLSSESGVGYDVFAITKIKNNVIHINLATRKVTLIDGIEDIAVNPRSFSWGQQSRIIVGSGNFAEHLLVSSEKSVTAIDGHRRHLHCEWQSISHGYVIVSFVSSRF